MLSLLGNPYRDECFRFSPEVFGLIAVTSNRANSSFGFFGTIDEVADTVLSHSLVGGNRSYAMPINEPAKAAVQNLIRLLAMGCSVIDQVDVDISVILLTSATLCVVETYLF